MYHGARGLFNEGLSTLDLGPTEPLPWQIGWAAPKTVSEQPGWLRLFDHTVHGMPSLCCSQGCNRKELPASGGVNSAW